MISIEAAGMIAGQGQCIGKAQRSDEGLFIDLVPTSTRGGSLNLTDQTDQAENRAGPVNSEDYVNGCLASDHFARQKTQEGSSLIQFHSYCQVLALTASGTSR